MFYVELAAVTYQLNTEYDQLKWCKVLAHSVQWLTPRDHQQQTVSIMKHCPCLRNKCILCALRVQCVAA